MNLEKKIITFLYCKIIYIFWIPIDPIHFGLVQFDFGREMIDPTQLQLI